ncbi:MAG: aminopeptidase [Clostridium sp.]
MINEVTINKIKEISLCEDKRNELLVFFKKQGEKLYNLCLLEEKLNDEYFKTTSFEELLKENHEIYEDLIGDNYKTCYGNPDYAVAKLGKEVGQIVTYLYGRLNQVINLVFAHKTEYIEKLLSLFIHCYEYAEGKGDSAEGLLKVVAEFEAEIMEFECEERVKNIAVYTENSYKAIVEEATSEDLRYLFKYGKYITENEIKTAKFLSTYEGVEKIAYTMVKGYMDSFERENKDYKIKDRVKVVYFVGQEAIVKEVIKEFGKFGLTTMMTNVMTTDVNKQYDYDHRFDFALCYDEAMGKLKEEKLVAAFEKYKTELKGYSGIAVFEAFGEIPFAPESKESSLKLSEKQSKIFQEVSLSIRITQDKFIPGAETTFTIIAFPTPEIGEKFEEIFADTMRINTLDSDKWERIQNSIIGTLDKGEFIHVKGCNGNRTDIKVKMHDLENPEKETNFENCIATVNIPVGEVFTSPTLEGTNGVLHVEEVFLDGLKYTDLELLFKDGYVEKYSCKNFDEEEKNKKFIEENLLFPHKTLPLGEFAIGTNTLAYVIAQKHDIVSILPVLIVEKMGPHFAVGDTCYSYSEDNRVYNQFDGKEIVAKDNEKSILRKTDKNSAYTQCHTDITIPYDSIGAINAITKNGEVIEVIKEGRFVLSGTEELNEPFQEAI